MTDEMQQRPAPPAAGSEADSPEEAARDAAAEPGTGAWDANVRSRGRRHIGRVDVDLEGVRAIEVVAVDFDDPYQEAGALAVVRDVADGARRVDDLDAPLRGVLAPDEHGPFEGEVVGTASGEAEVRITHVHRTDGEQ